MQLQQLPASEHVVQAVQSLPQAAVKLLVCDVDGVLFNISTEMLAAAFVDRDGFFFNTKQSVPDHQSRQGAVG